MRVPPCELPRAWPASNCSSSTTSCPRRASHHAVADPIAPAPTTATSTLTTDQRGRSADGLELLGADVAGEGAVAVAVGGHGSPVEVAAGARSTSGDADRDGVDQG